MTVAAEAAAPIRVPRRRFGAFARRHVLTVFASLSLIYLFVPIAVVIVFGFNNPAGRFNYTWNGFTLENWLHPFAVPGIAERARGQHRDRVAARASSRPRSAR